MTESAERFVGAGRGTLREVVCAGNKVKARRQGGVAFDDDVAYRTRSLATVAFDFT